MAQPTTNPGSEYMASAKKKAGGSFEAASLAFLARSSTERNCV
jgi:hypothetical protein